MRITDLAIPPDRIAHIAKHSVNPEEVWEAAFDDANRLVQRLESTTSGPKRMVYRLLGRTEAGRYLLIIFIYRGGGRAYLVTARDMVQAERRYYLGRKG